MSAPLPIVPNTMLLGDADLHIKALAMAVDMRLGTNYKFVPINDNPTINSNGDIIINVNMSGTRIDGALVQIAKQVKGPGQVANAPPVPPASIGVLIPNTIYNIVPFNFNPNPNQIWASVRTSVWTGKTYDNQLVSYGSQRAYAGISFQVIGLAWGPV